MIRVHVDLEKNTRPAVVVRARAERTLSHGFPLQNTALKG